MRRSRSRAPRLACAALLGVSLCAPALSHASDDSEAFVEALRSRGMYETALTFLDRAAGDVLSSDEFKQRIAYEQGVTLIQMAQTVDDREFRERRLAEANARLDEAVEAHRGTLLGAMAQNRLGNISVERGRALMQRAERLPSTKGAEKTELVNKARALFDQAGEVFSQSEQFYAAELKRLPPIVKADSSEQAAAKNEKSPPARSAAAEARRQQEELSRTRQKFRGELVQSRMLVATVLYEKAQTYAPDSEERKTLLTEAVEKYADLYDKYHRWMIGLYARLWQGRCYRQLGELDKAIGCFEDLIIQDARVPAFRTLIAKALQAQAECYIDQKKYDPVIAKCGTWIEEAGTADLRDPDWLGVKYQLAVAHKMKSESTEAANERQSHVSRARKLAQDVSRWPNDRRADARKMFASLGPEEAAVVDPKTFDEAFEAGQTALETMKSLQLAVTLARENNPDELPQIEKDAAAQQQTAYQYFRRAIDLANDESDPKNVVMAQSQLAYLNYKLGEFYDAAVLGEHVARRHPDSSSGRFSAKIALSSYKELFLAAAEDDRAFASQHVMDIANYIEQQWPGEKEAGVALQVLVDFALRAGDLEAAREYVDKINPDEQALPLFRIGLAEWAQYVRAVRMKADQRPDQAQLDAMKDRAQANLESAVSRLEENAEITPAIATGILYLAQIYLETSQYDKAIEQLEDERWGPLTLVTADHPAAAGERFIENTYEMALRAYVSVQPAAREKALSIMDVMEHRATSLGDEEGQERITKVYIDLGRKLQAQLERLTLEGKADELQRVSTAFVDFLDRVSERETGNTWASRIWVAQTFYNLAAGREASSTKAQSGAAPVRSEQAQAFFGKSAAAFEKLLDEAAADPAFAPSPEAILGAKVRLAESLRQSGNYREALALFASVLSERPNDLGTQVAAAYTYQERGAAENPKSYNLARNGGAKDPSTGENRIWGWRKLAQRAYRYPKNAKYRKIYFEAEYNDSLCRFKHAMSKQGPARKSELEKVDRKLQNMNTLWSGEIWDQERPRYDRLLKDVQSARRVRAVGYKKS